MSNNTHINKINSAIQALQEAIESGMSLDILDRSHEAIESILNLIGVEKVKPRILTNRRIESERSRFENAPGLRQAAVYEYELEPNLPIEVRAFWLKKSTKTNISWVSGLSAKYGDDPNTYTHKNVGITFVLDLSKRSLFIVLSQQSKLRVLELNGKLTPTQYEILSKWKDISEEIRKNQERDEKDLKEIIQQKLWESFDFEPVNRRFYAELSEYFNELVHEFMKHKIEENDAKLFSTRLIGRLIFLWFLRKKSFIEESYGYFNPEAFDSDKTYYREKLELLFFKILNREIRERKKEGIEDLETPFLNGGLFEATEVDRYKKEVFFPHNFFSRLFHFLNHYNFTVDEGTSEYQQVAIDPEMLGRIFENLLASFVEETGERARKAKGAFYTPREIVDYMCRESLLLYITEKFGDTPLKKERIKELISMSESQFRDQDHNKRRDFKRDLPYKEIEKDLLENITILDPAVGSGAFPMGMLHLIGKVVSRLESKWERKESELKEKILSSALYGVDIDNMAIQISRLRAWLSIIVDMKSRKEVKPLPNLDFKFVCANTLIPLEKKSGQNGLFDDVELKEKLISIRNEYYQEHRKKRKEVLRRKYLELIGADKGNQARLDESEYTRKLKSYNPFDPANSTKFYDPELMHGVDKFDIVIGNPPYVSLEKIPKEVKEEYKKHYSVFAPRGDLYTLFYERGVELLKEGGYLTYITSNKWMRADYGKKLRSFFLSKNPLKLLDLGEGVFESATVDTNILILQNSENKNWLEACAFGSDYKKGEDIAEYFETHKIKLDKEDLKDDVWFIGSKEEIAIKKKIEKAGTPLKDWDVEINYGIKTGFNQAFIIDTETKEKLIKEDPKSAEIIKPILRGRDVGRYYADFAGKWLIVVKFGDYKTLAEKYPAIYKHLKQYEDKLKNRGQCKYTRSKKSQEQKDYPGQHHWLELDNNPTNEYLQKFEQEKIVWQRITKKPTFYLSLPGEYILDSMAFVSDLKESGKYLLGILNSKLVAYWVKNNVHQYGSTGYRLSNQYVEQIPIPQITPQNKHLAEQIEILVDKILQLKKQDKHADTKHLEAQIDELVFELYRLSEG